MAVSDLWRYTADVIHLVDNPIVREAFFPSAQQQLAIERARPEALLYQAGADPYKEDPYSPLDLDHADLLAREQAVAAAAATAAALAAIPVATLVVWPGPRRSRKSAWPWSVPPPVSTKRRPSTA